MSFDLTKALTIVSALPALGNIVLQGVQAVETVIPHTGVVNQKVQMVTQYVDGGVRAILAGVQEVESLIPIATGLAANLLNLIEQIKTGAVVAIPPPQPVAPPSPSPAPGA